MLYPLSYGPFGAQGTAIAHRPAASERRRPRVFFGMDTFEKTDGRRSHDASGARAIADFAVMLLIAVAATLATIALIS